MSHKLSIALTGDQTCSPFVYGTTLQPTEPRPVVCLSAAIYLEVELWGNKACIYSALIEKLQFFQSGCNYYAHSHWQCGRVLVIPHPPSLQPFRRVHSNIYHIVTFICQLVRWTPFALFIVHLDISSLVKCLFKSFSYFLMGCLSLS